ncbi:recombinase family protein [Paenibacillus tepidiphilus]|uniref:recombinase family protein n=1 Tax=Paenibacillus tepidiphilus TaxID=2608683 RepID=UPI00123C1DA5|nr:recombinase family protein [Paenibacillus tepidiphilus]
MKTVLYCRSSIESQENSISMQRTISEAVAAQRSLLIDEEYIDTAVSARINKISDRPNLARLLTDIKRGNVKTLIAYKRDRLARNVGQHLEIYEILKKYNVQVIFSASNELPLQYSPAGEFFELIIAGFNEREVNQIAHRIRDTKLALFSDGKNHGGKLPFGYFLDAEKIIQPDPIKVEKIEMIFNELLVTECRTFSEFVRYLESKRIIEKHKSNYNKIKKYITTPEYMGFRRAKFNEDIIEIEQKRLKIIDEDKWNQAQMILNTLIQSRGKQKSEVSMLDELVFCATCNEPLKRKLISMAGKESVMYYCSAHYRNKIPQQFLEKYVLEEATKWAQNIAYSQNSVMLMDVINRVNAESAVRLLELEQKMKILKDNVIGFTEKWILNKDPHTQREMVTEYSKLVQYEHQKKLLLRTQNYIGVFPARIQAIWTQLNVQEKLNKMNSVEIAEVLKDIVSKIEIGPPDFSPRIELKHPFLKLVNIKDGEITIEIKNVD